MSVKYEDTKINKINETKVYRDYKKDHNLSVKIGLLLIIVTYLFFFMSSSIFQKESIASHTPLKSKQTFDDKKISFTIEQWKYSKNQKLMEVTLKIDNSDLKDNSFSYVSMGNYKNATSGKYELETEIKVNEFNYAIVWIKNIPDDFNGIVLYVIRNGASEDENMVLMLQTESKYVKRVNNISSKTTLSEYRIETLSDEIHASEKAISQYKEKIVNSNNDIKLIQKKIEEVQDSQLYLYGSELQESEHKIQSYQNKISSKKNSIIKYQTKINEENQKIQEYNTLIEKFKSLESQNNQTQPPT